MGRGHPGVYRLWLQARDIDKADEDGMEGAAVYKGEVYVGAIAVSFRCIKNPQSEYGYISGCGFYVWYIVEPLSVVRTYTLFL